MRDHDNLKVSDTSACLSWIELWNECSNRLGSTQDARRIVEQVSKHFNESWVSSTHQVPDAAIELVNSMVNRRLDGEPLQYVLGEWGFRKLEVNLDSRVLIPRPETEQVVQTAIEIIKQFSNPIAVDFGTGSGVIGFSLALEVDNCLVYATDNSKPALEVAQNNLRKLPTRVRERIELLYGSWYQAMPVHLRGNIDLIISNPPYIAESDFIDEQVKKWEPPEALFSGVDGLNAIREIFSHAYHWLNNQGAVVVEIGSSQADDVQQIAKEAGFSWTEAGKDFAGRDRWIVARKSKYPTSEIRPHCLT